MVKLEEQARRLLSGLGVVLVETRFPENIGMAARACVNMGLGIRPASEIPPLCLIRPERWLKEKAAPLATAKGLPLLEDIPIFENLEEAIADATLVIGTTARTGGWRQGILSPERGAALVLDALCSGGRAALVFGPEDRGLSNSDIGRCTQLVHIPSNPEAGSLNLAQAALLMLYECRKAALSRASNGAPMKKQAMITHRERELLYSSLQQALTAIDTLHGDNPDYFMLPVRRFFNRSELSRGEFDLFMGICRQICWATRKN